MISHKIVHSQYNWNPNWYGIVVRLTAIQLLQPEGEYSLAEHFCMLYVQPLRITDSYAERAIEIFHRVTEHLPRNDTQSHRRLLLSDSHLQVGDVMPSCESHCYQSYSVTTFQYFCYVLFLHGWPSCHHHLTHWLGVRYSNHYAMAAPRELIHWFMRACGRRLSLKLVLER